MLGGRRGSARHGRKFYTRFGVWNASDGWIRHRRRQIGNDFDGFAFDSRRITVSDDESYRGVNSYAPIMIFSNKKPRVLARRATRKRTSWTKILYALLSSDVHAVGRY